MVFEQTVRIDRLRERHPVYSEFADEWRRLRLLYQGGGRLKACAGEFLTPRPHEPGAQLAQRWARLTYQNILGSGLGWYLSALFRDGAQIDYTSAKGAGSSLLEPATAGGKMGKTTTTGESIYSEFLGDADRARHSLFEVARDCFEDVLLTQRAYLMVDFPRASAPVANRMMERELGLDRPHVMRLSPDTVTNWGEDAHGNLDWAIIENVRLAGDPLQENRPQIQTWMVVDRQEYAVYQVAAGNKDWADLVESGPHALSQINRVPIERWVAPDSMWLGDRVYLPVVDHLNQENTLSWQLFMGNLAIPVIISDGDVAFGVGEASYIKLPTGSSYQWSEPAGTTIAASQQRCDSLREEIYRQLHLQAQARSNAATPAAQSGISKAQDVAPSKDILDGFGDLLRPALTRLLETVALAIGDDQAKFTVRGFSFAEGTTASVTRLIEARMAVIPSDTLMAELEKAAALELLGDATVETKATVCREIDAAPPVSERTAAEAQAMQEAMDARLGAVAGIAQGIPPAAAPWKEKAPRP